MKFNLIFVLEFDCETNDDDEDDDDWVKCIVRLAEENKKGRTANLMLVSHRELAQGLYFTLFSNNFKIDINLTLKKLKT